ncbi:class I adenylate-forming enzyme family protein [Natronomonas marina]|jgi:acyl-coenzyme A synthetase/AMP-(fatty) acid ligase|uniref:class I adenylate-forming enzyme family protein n=1 Tax=Natronomonas marina TaxID=2961939 RepID=UPI0020C9E7F4|nr:class I adenylate-forming enzyme family protein [Natronomonas marina]
MSRAYEDVQQRLAPEMRDIESVGEVLGTAADLWGEAPYMTYAPTGESFSFAGMNRRANRVANALAEIGVAAGDRVGLYLTNGPEFVVSIFGCAKLGAIEAPINWQYRKREVVHAIESAEIETVVAEADDGMVDVLLEAAPETDALQRVVVTGDHRFEEIEALSGVDVYRLADLESAVGDAAPDPGVGREDPVSILYTSGTTGLPKPTVLANESFLLAAKSMLGVPFDDDDVNYNPYPLFHANNQCYSMLASAIHGSEYVLSDAFSAGEFWEEVTENGVTSFNLIGGVPKILDSRFEADEIPENDIELAVGPISTELWEGFEEKFDLTVIQIYSQTESPTLLVNYPDLEEIAVGAIGKPMFPDLGHEAWAQADDGSRLGAGEEGELVRTDPGSMIEYWDQPEKTEETLRDGRIYSGDIVRTDEEGYFYYVDRKKFMVRRSGENISAQEVENVLDELPGVSESAIIPVPDEIRGEEVKAMVMRVDESVTERDVVLRVGRTLAPYKVPRYVEFVEEFPRTPTERIQRVKLADREKDRTDHGWDRSEAFPDWQEEL